MNNKELIKQAFVSILIGAAIAFLTTLMQGLLDWLKGVYVEPAGTVAGLGYYLSKIIKRG